MTIFIENVETRAEIIKKILLDLPEWFGIPEATSRYIEDGKNMIMIAEIQEGMPIGFISLNPHNADTVEIHVMGILKNYHRQGFGAALFHEAEIYAKTGGYKLMEVKTLDPSFVPYNVEYDITRKYYEKMGFLKLECVKELWGEDCPCLIMVKVV